MGLLAEVVLESVDKDCILDVLQYFLIKNNSARQANCTQDISLVDNGVLSINGVQEFLKFNGDAAVVIEIESIINDQFLLNNVQLRLIKYSNQYDIEFNFNNELIENSTEDALKGLHDYVVKLASDFNILTFYCGLEPASDEDTRYFTNEKLGPLLV